MSSKDILSLIYNMEETDLERHIHNNYGININTLFNSIPDDPQSDFIDTLFEHCYIYLLGNDPENLCCEYNIKHPIIELRTYNIFNTNHVSPDGLFRQLKSNAILYAAYTLKDLHSTNYMRLDIYNSKWCDNPFEQATLQSDSYYKFNNVISPSDISFYVKSDDIKVLNKRLISLYESFPSAFFNIDLFDSDSRIKNHIRGFLPLLDLFFLTSNAKKDISKSFLNKKATDNVEGKRLNYLMQKDISHLSEFYLSIYKKCLSTPNSTDRFFYYMKLESLLGVELFLSCLKPYSENKLSIEDIKFFQEFPAVYYRLTLLREYMNKEISKNTLLYLKNRFIPLLTNTFYLLLTKKFGNDALNVILNYIDKYASPTAKDDYSHYMEWSTKNFPTYYETLKPLPAKDNRILRHEEWLSTWSHIESRTHSDFYEIFKSDHPFVEQNIDCCKANLDKDKKSLLLKYLYERYLFSNSEPVTARFPETTDI